MFGSEILDVVIGLICFFLVLSLVCSSIKEAFETVLKYRARDLEHGIREMLSTDGSPTSTVAALYAHPLINALFKGKYDPKHTGNLPSYIPPATFALALLDVVHPATTTVMAPVGQDSAVSPHFAAAQKMRELRSAIVLHPNTAVQGALLPLLDAAENDAVQMRKNIEDWFNGVMDRVSGWYKRRTQIIIAVTGLSICFLFNADAIGIARYLGTNQTARAVMVAKAQREAREDTAPGTSDLKNPLGWLEEHGGIPIGWRSKQAHDGKSENEEADWRHAPVTAGGWAIKLAGLLCTTFAISLGAPFWFDALNRFMVVRSTVKPQEKSKDESSKS